MAFCFNSHRRLLRLATHWHPLFSTTQLKSHHEIRLFTATATATAAAAAQIPHDSEIFNYTSGRWLSVGAIQGRSVELIVPQIQRKEEI